MKTFKEMLREARTGVKTAPEQDDVEEVLGMKPRSKGEEDFKDAHKIEKKKHPVATEDQFKGGTKTYKQMKEEIDLSEGKRLDAKHEECLERSKKALKEIGQFLTLSDNYYSSKRIADTLEALAVNLANEADIREHQQKMRSFYNEETEELSEEIKPGSLKLKSGETVIVDKKEADVLNDVLKDLSDSNRKKMEDELKKDKKSYMEMVSFAKKA